MLNIVFIFIAVVVFIYITTCTKKIKLETPSVLGGANEEREKIRRGSDALKYLEKYGEEIRDELKTIMPQ